MQTAPDTEEWLTVRQAAALLRLGERTVRNHINGHRLPARRLPGGKGWLVRRDDLLATLQGPPPMAASGMGIIRRTQTPEGRARALSALDSLLEGDADEQRRAWEHLQKVEEEDPVQFRRWDVQTWDPIEERNQNP